MNPQLSFDFTIKPKLYPMYLSLIQAKDLIHQATKSTIEQTYKECWRSIAPNEKIKLEKWWLNNKDSLPQLREDWLQGEKEIYVLKLTPEQKLMDDELLN